MTKAKSRFAEARAVELLSGGPDRIANRCQHEGEPCPGAPWQGLAYEQQLVHKRDQVDEALRRIGGLDGFELEEIEPALEQWRYRNKLEYSCGAARRGDRARLPRPRPLGPDRRRRGLPARLRARQRRPQRGARMGARRSGRPLRPRRRQRHPLQPGRARGAAQRPDPDPPRHHTGAASRSRRSTCTPWSIAGSGGSDGPTGALGEERLRERLCGLDFEMSYNAFFQTNTEMAERLYGVAAEYAGLERRRAGLRPLLRDRHDRADDGEAGRRGLGAGDRPRGDRRRGAQRRAQRDRERALPRRQRPHRRAAADRAGRQARRRRGRPAPPRPLAEDRAAGAGVRGEADRLRLLQPDDAGPQRRPAGRGRL